jgi:hypothetical protein
MNIQYMLIEYSRKRQAETPRSLTPAPISCLSPAIC